jgi:hypothetical protein
MNQLTFTVGSDAFLAGDSPHAQYSAIFEDEGETGYFYAVDLERDQLILDATHIYNVKDVIDRDRQSTASIVWSKEGLRCALLINDYPHAAFDFTLKRGYCRTNFPNFPGKTAMGWSQSDHSWSDDAVAWLGNQVVS